MIYATLSVENGQAVIKNQRTIKQSELTSDCFLIQIEGATACTSCECLNKPRKCGGMSIRAKLGVPEPVVRKRNKQKTL